MTCPRCQQDNPVADAQFCPRCGAPVKNAGDSHQPAASYGDLLEQQAATGAILRVISQSPTAAEPVFGAIVRSAAALCHAPNVLILIADGDSLRVAASVGPVAAAAQTSQVLQDGRLPLTRGSVAARAFIDGRTVHIHDVGAMPDDEFPEGKALQRAYGGHGTTLAVPLLRDNVSVGVITLLRNEVSPFSDQLIKLLQTFADQALIAIENVRLFTELNVRNRELTDSLTQQTATAEILRVISSSPTDIQPVLEAVTASAARLCEAPDAAIFLAADQELRLATHLGPIALGPIGEFTVPLVRGSLTGRVTLERRTIQLTDHQTEETEYPEGTAVARRLGVHTMLAVPLLRSGEAIGVIALRRTEIRLFTDQQIALLQTFADQAVIAIENVRLFTELQQRNAALTEAHTQVTETLEQQTATSEILRAISSSPTDAQPVFNAIARSAVQLCGASFGAVFRFDAELVHMAAHQGLAPDELRAALQLFPVRMTPRAVGVQLAIRERRIVHISDIKTDPEWQASRVSQTLGPIAGYRSFLAVPLLRDDVSRGAINVWRREPDPFSEKQIALLKTFADQAVIAIENVRLFKELQEKNKALTQAHAQVSEALEQQTASSEILKVIASSSTDLAPV